MPIRSRALLKIVYFVFAACTASAYSGPGSDSKPTCDMAITNVSVPSDCVAGDTVSLTVSVVNQGAHREAFRVILTDQTGDKEIASKKVTLAKGWKDGSEDVADVVFTETAGKQHLGDWLTFGDVNGDGFNDLLVSAVGYNFKQGRVYLYHGGKSMDNDADKIFTGENKGDGLGDNGICLADMNNDGFDDVILGARFHNKRGRVYIHWGGPNMDEKADVIIDSEAGVTNSSFGRGVDAGDLNGDGHLDLIVSAIGYKNFTGRTYLYYGPIASDTSADKVFTGEHIDDGFGAVIATGDVDGDNYDDLILGTRYYPQNTGTGRVYFYYGGPGSTMDETCDMIFGAENRGDEFGCAVDLCDVDNDGHADVLISAREYGVGQGRAYLYWGKNRESMDNTPDLIFEGERGSSFGGACIHGGNFNNDDYQDIVISAYNYPNRLQWGRSYVYYGDKRTLMDVHCDYVFNGEQTRCAAQRTYIGDFNGDGHGDVVMSGWKYNNFQGKCWLWYGPFDTTTDITFTWDTTNASLGKHVLKATIAPVVGEEDVADNTMTVTVDVKECSK